MRVAIIGAGPRGLWACEELVARARERGADIDVTVFNDGPLSAASGPGAYQLEVPDTWLLNVDAAVVRSALGSFNEWRGATDTYPSRRKVGEFLLASWRSLLDHLPPTVRLSLREQEVSTIAARDGGFEVAGELFDEVLVTTGHARTWPGALTGTQIPGVDKVVPAFPASALDTVTAADIAIVRGAALTFIDVARHTRAEIIYPLTRTGRFMDVKAVLEESQVDELGPDLAVAQQRIRQAKDFAEFTHALVDLAVAVARVGGAEVSVAEVEAVLEGRDGRDPVADLRTSYEVALGQRPWTAAAAVGYAFRQAYDAIVARASFGGRDSLGGARFGQLTATLERVAFGPPPQTAGEILALIDSGRIRTDLLGRGESDIAELAAQVGATAVIDAVNAPPGPVPGTLAGELVSQGLAPVHPETGAIMVDREGTVSGQRHLACAGRMSEGWILGHDTLRRGSHEVIPAWARRVSRAAMADPERVHGVPPLPARVAQWAKELVADPAACQSLIDSFGSPVNVLNNGPMLANVDELVAAAAHRGVELKVFYARKANKGLTFVDAVRDSGHGVDVASENELRQVLAAGVPGQRIILSAAIKPDALLSLAISQGVVISADNRDEYDRIAALAKAQPALVAPRLAPDPETMPPTRFGERASAWAQHLAQPSDRVRVVGVHVHLHGYAAADRRAALTEAIGLIDVLRAGGHNPEFIDLGGGVPMSYLERQQDWEHYQEAIVAQRAGHTPPFTWKSDPLTNTYPYWQRPTRGPWLEEVLGDGLAEALIERGVRLHLEPGRSLLDGCGLILAQVAFVKTRSDGLPLVGLHMNRTQCRTTSDDYLVDPILVKRTAPSAEVEAYLVGAYCIEDEVILRRRIRFPQGVAAGDIIAIPNTAGYFMHILESASHQIPLAKNVNWPAGQLDAIDRR